MNYFDVYIFQLANMFAKRGAVDAPDFVQLISLLTEGRLKLGDVDFVVAHAFWRASQGLPPIWSYLSGGLAWKKTEDPVEILEMAVNLFVSAYRLDDDFFGDQDSQHDWMGNPKGFLPGQFSGVFLQDPRVTN